MFMMLMLFFPILIFFYKKLYVLLILEALMLLVIFSFFLNLSYSFNPQFSCFILSIMMVLESVVGVSILISCARLSYVYSCSFNLF